MVRVTPVLFFTITCAIVGVPPASRTSLIIWRPSLPMSFIVALVSDGISGLCPSWSGQPSFATTHQRSSPYGLHDTIKLKGQRSSSLRGRAVLVLRAWSPYFCLLLVDCFPFLPCLTLVAYEAPSEYCFSFVDFLRL